MKLRFSVEQFGVETAPNVDMDNAVGALLVHVEADDSGRLHMKYWVGRESLQQKTGEQIGQLLDLMENLEKMARSATAELQRIQPNPGPQSHGERRSQL